MSYEIRKQQYNLRKTEVENVAKSKDLENEKARVALVLDLSGSMAELYNNGTVQSVVDRILPIAVKFDDNAELDIWVFAKNYGRIHNVTEQNYLEYVQRKIINDTALVDKVDGSGTYYAPVLKDILLRYIKQEPISYSSYVIFITDGENADRNEANEIIRELSHYSIFFQFIGIGKQNFSFLQSLDTMIGRFIDNANFFALDDLNKISDTELYNRLLNEYPSWLKEARQKGILPNIDNNSAFNDFLNKFF
jgi:hypothetical protein